MNDRELDLALDRLGVEHVRRTAPSTLRHRVHVVPLAIKPRLWLRPFPTWRFQSMFSVTKSVVAGAIVALFGSLLLAGVLTQPSDVLAPAASDTATQALEPASVVTGHLDAGYELQGPASSYGDENVGVPGDGMDGRLRGLTFDPGRIEMADTRLSGDITFTVNADGWYVDGYGTPALEWGTVLIENDGGTWEGTWSKAHGHVYGESDEGQIVSDVGPIVMRLVGTRDYEGLSAILYGTTKPTADPPSAAQLGGESVQGIVFPGNLPPDREVAPGSG